LVNPLKYLASGDSDAVVGTITTDTIMTMADADLEVLSYNLRVAYASQLNSGGNGSISIGSDYTSIGTATNTRSSRAVNSYTTAEYTAAGSTYPAYPSGTARADTTYNYQQLQTVPSFPSDATLDSDGFAYYGVSGGTGISRFRTAETVSVFDDIINDCITEMQTGDEVGTYRIQTYTPTNGGAGTWTNKGTFFDDDRYPLPLRADGAITYLYLKTDLDTPPTGTGAVYANNAIPLGLTSDGNLKQRGTGTADGLIQNVLLPILTRKISDGALVYDVDEFPYTGQPVSSIYRGAAVDTRYIGQAFTQYNGILTASAGDDPETISVTKRYHSLATPEYNFGGQLNANVKTYRLYLQVE